MPQRDERRDPHAIDPKWPQIRSRERYYDAPMLDLLRFVRGLVADLFLPRAALLAENAMLRQQLIVAEGSRFISHARRKL